MYDIDDIVALTIPLQLEFRNVNFYKREKQAREPGRTDRYGIRTPTSLALGGRRASLITALSLRPFSFMCLYADLPNSFLYPTPPHACIISSVT